MTNLNKVSHSKLVKDLTSGKTLKNYSQIIKKHSKLLENLYKYDKGQR